MTCKEVVKLIPAFQEDNLTNQELKEFVRHIETCPECKEELSIYYLVNEGMLLLESGTIYDLQKSLQLRMEKAYSQLRFRRFLQLGAYCLEVLVGIAILVILALIAF